MSHSDNFSGTSPAQVHPWWNLCSKCERKTKGSTQSVAQNISSKSLEIVQTECSAQWFLPGGGTKGLGQILWNWENGFGVKIHNAQLASKNHQNWKDFEPNFGKEIWRCQTEK